MHEVLWSWDSLHEDSKLKSLHNYDLVNKIYYNFHFKRWISISLSFHTFVYFFARAAYQTRRIPITGNKI